MAGALELARQACERTGYKSAQSLDILAAAYAELGRFDEAADAARQAVRLARAANKTQLAEQFEARLGLYLSGKPYRLPGGPEH